MIQILKRLRRKNSPLGSHPYYRALSGVNVGIIATDGFEQSEMFSPLEALRRAGAIVHIVSPKAGRIVGWHENNWGRSIHVDMTVREAWTYEFDALLVPGGVINPDRLRTNSEAVAFVMAMINKRRPVAAICHGAQLLIETGALKGIKLTSSPSIKTDLENAGAYWLNKDVVVDNRIITSRGPKDLPYFNKAIVREFGYGRLHPLTEVQNEQISQASQ
jgi:protease I